MQFENGFQLKSKMMFFNLEDRKLTRVGLAIEVTRDVVQVQYPGVWCVRCARRARRAPVVGAQQPLHVAVTQPRVAAKQELGQLVYN